MVARTSEAMERSYVRVVADDVHTIPPHTRRVFFVGAGRKDRAFSFVASLPENLRASVAVIGRPDCMEDAIDALKLGAGDLLASPLSPQQVVGAMERLSETGALRERTKATGLPIYRADDRTGGNLLTVKLGTGDELSLAALTLRRFLRGYDRVGEDGTGNLAALVYCPPEDMPAVVGRIEVVMGERAKVSFTAGSVRAAVAA